MELKQKLEVLDKKAFPDCINSIKFLPDGSSLTLLGKVILMAFDDISIKSALESTEKNDLLMFCSLCARSLASRQIGPDWDFVKQAIDKLAIDPKGPKTIINEYLKEFPFPDY